MLKLEDLKPGLPSTSHYAAAKSGSKADYVKRSSASVVAKYSPTLWLTFPKMTTTSMPKNKKTWKRLSSMTPRQELTRRGLKVRRQVPVPIRYEDMVFDEGFRADLIVEDCIVLELKSVEQLAPVHSKQTLSYCRLLDYRLGLLINFGAPLIKDGIKRIVTNLEE